MTAVTQKPDQAGRDAPARSQGRLRTLTVAVTVLSIAVIGLGAWLVYELVAEPETAVPGEIESLLDDYRAAWNEYDGDAFLELVTDDYAFEFDGDVTPADEQAAAIVSSEAIAGNVETVGAPITYGDGPTYFVTQFDLTTSTVMDMEGISVITVIEDGDVFRVQHHLFFDGE